MDIVTLMGPYCQYSMAFHKELGQHYMGIESLASIFSQRS